MDTTTGRIYEDAEKLRDIFEDHVAHGGDPNHMSLMRWNYGERVEIKGCWFEVTKIDARKQRLVLKPIPQPTDAR